MGFYESQWSNSDQNTLWLLGQSLSQHCYFIYIFIFHIISQYTIEFFVRIFIYIDTWFKNVYDNTLVQYKAMCTNWFIGGDGCTVMFEDWDEAKLSKYEIHMSDHDHHDVSSRTTILIDNYHKHKFPYLSMIHLWDEMK